ncbi:MAG TPA: extracellular solute-binding protein [Clostridia bacterium]|nr:extracellular solute-binding protein [Clostridia bacterium]
MKLIRKEFTLAVLLVCAMMVLGGCQEKDGSTDSASSGDDSVKIKVWTLWTDTTDDINAVAFRKALETAKTDLPDIIIEHDATENEAYKTKIKTAIAGNAAPDVFFAWGAGFVRQFVDAGKVEPLDQYLTDGTTDRMKGGANTNFIFDGKTYGITFSQWVASLYCNKALFDTYDVNIPETYDDLMQAVKTFNANDVIPITVGGKDKWPAMFWQNAFAVKTTGAETCNAALAGEASFDTPEFVRSAQLLADLVEEEAFVDGALGLDYNESGALYLEGQAAMYYMGNWFAGDIAGHDSDIGKNTVVARFPVVPNGEGDETQYLGGSIDGLSVSADSENKEAAATVAKYLMEQVARNLAAAGEGLPTWNTEDVTSEKTNPIIDQIKSQISNSTGYVLAWDTFLSGADADDHKNYVASIFGQELSPEKFAARMQEMNE